MAKPLGVSEKAGGPSMCVCGPPTTLEGEAGVCRHGVAALHGAKRSFPCSFAFFSDGLCIGSLPRMDLFWYLKGRFSFYDYVVDG